MERRVWVLTMLVLASRLPEIRATADVMKDVTLGFGEALKHCREESQLTEEKMEDFLHYWRKDFKFEDRELGCAIQCMGRHYNLLDDSVRMHHENTHNFIKSFPNGEMLAKQMVELIHECEKKHDGEEDHCWRILRVAECFKLASVERGIAPNVEVLLAEFIMESDAGNL